MKIVDCTNQPVQACVVFDYKGSVVSASTIFRPHSVFVCDPLTAAFLSPQLDTVEEAIKWIDDMLEKDA